MVGREGERAQIEQILEQVPHGPVGIALEGPPGIGKSTLWREAVRARRDRGYRVLCTAPAEPDALLTFAGLGDLFEAVVSEVSSDLPDPQRRALTAALLLEDASDAPANPEALPRAVLTVMHRLAASGPVVLAIDDEQWLDRASARVLAFALTRLRDEPVGVILARRPNSDSALWPELVKGFPGAGVNVVTIAPLDLRTTDLLLKAQLTRTIARPVLRRIYAASEGNPLHSLAIARELPTNQGAGGGGDVPVPRTIAEAMRHRLQQLDDRASDALLTVAASSSPTLALLQAVIPDFELGDLDGPVRSGVVEISGERVRFTHPLLASTHYSAAPGTRCRQLHRTLAAVLDDEEQQARHMALGAEAPDQQLAVTLEQAARTAHQRGAPETAAELLEQAARLTPLQYRQARQSRWISASHMHYLSGDYARVHHLLETLLPELPPGSTRARALYWLTATRHDDYDTVAQMLDRALSEAAEDDGLRARLESSYCEVLTGLGRFTEAVDHARLAVECAQRARDRGLLTDAIASKAAAAFWTGTPVDFDELEATIELEDLSDTNTTMLPSFVLGQVTYRFDDLANGRSALQRALQRATRRGEDPDIAAILFHLAVLEWSAGNHAEAKRKLADCKHTQNQLDPKSDAFVSWADSFIAAGRGDLTGARSKAEESLGPFSEPCNCVTRLHACHHPGADRPLVRTGRGRPRSNAHAARITRGRGVRCDRFADSRPLDAGHRSPDRARPTRSSGTGPR